MSTDNKEYVAITKFEGSYTGTLDEIFDQIEVNGVSLMDCEFYEIGNKVSVKLTVEE